MGNVTFALGSLYCASLLAEIKEERRAAGFEGILMVAWKIDWS